MPQQKLTPRINPLLLLMKVLSVIPVTVFLFTALILANVLQMLSVLLLPFSKKAFRKLNRLTANTWWGMCLLFVQTAYGTKVELTGDSVPVAENAIVVANHQQMPDITYLFFLAWSKKRLGDLKWIVKDIIKYMPGIGWGMLFLDCIFVKRNWSSDQAIVEKTFAKFNKENIPIWLISFPESTRITPEKLKESNRYSQSKGLEPSEHVLQPRTKGFCASVAGLRSHIKAVYDITIGYPEGVPTLGQYVMGFTRLACLHVRRYEIDELPQDEAGLAGWLQDCYQEKDRLLANFYKNGHFPQS